jgi:CRISPR-associated protein Cas4
MSAGSPDSSEEMLMDAIGEYLQMKKEVESDRRGDKTYYFVTDFGSCPRKVVYSMMNKEAEPFSNHSLFVFANGDSFHKRMCDWLREMEILVAEEYPFKTENGRIHGRIDSIVQMNEKKTVVEFKSINNRGFKYLKRPKTQHVIQVQLYLWFLKHFDDKHCDIDDCGRIIYEDKDEQYHKEFPIEYSPQIVADVFQLVSFFDRHLDEGTVPTRFFSDSDWQCKYCQYHDVCKKEGEGVDYGEDALAEKYCNGN